MLNKELSVQECDATEVS